MSTQTHLGLRVFSLNCQKSEEVVHSLLNSHSPAEWDILCIQESPLHITRFYSYSQTWTLLLPTTSASSSEPSPPRAAMFISRNLQSDSYTPLLIPSRDIVGISFLHSPSSSNSTPIVIFSIYNPPSSDSTISTLSTFLPALPPASSLILLGDFNSHHPLWSGTLVPDRTRRSTPQTLLSLMAAYHLQQILPPATPTFFSAVHNSWSTIDLVFVSSALADAVSQCDASQDGNGSDHSGIFLRLSLERLPTLSRERLQWRSADWVKYREALQGFLDTKLLSTHSPTLNHRSDIDKLAETLTKGLQYAAKVAVPVCKPCPHSKRWWSPELSRLHRQAANLRNRASKRNAKPSDYQAMLEVRKSFHKAIR